MDINEYSKTLSITSDHADKYRAAAESALESNPEQQTQQQQSNGGGFSLLQLHPVLKVAPQVQFLRELRDNTILQTQSLKQNLIHAHIIHSSYYCFFYS